MRIPIFQVDAFASAVFAGNPAAVCPLEHWLDERTLQAIAAENNLSETAFFVAQPDGRHHLRWFTPVCEIDLCGHATLASAFVLFEHLDKGRARVTFSTLSGDLTVERQGELLAMAFPTRAPVPCTVPAELIAGLGLPPAEVLAARDFLAIYATEEEVRALEPDFHALKRTGRHAVIATAPGTRSDFVSRFFAPAIGVDEDPVTGSAHCTLVPYWARRLGKTHLHALQVSRRGGELHCEQRPDHVVIAGRAVLFLDGHIYV